MALKVVDHNTFVSNFSRVVAEQLKIAFPLHLADVETSQIGLTLQKAIREKFPAPTDLVSTKPDYEYVLAQLMSEVERSSTWADSDLAATGQMILRAIATDVTFGQFSIARALQEAYLDTARADVSVFRAARHLGNKLVRNESASAPVLLTRAESDQILTIPAYSKFSLDGGDGLRRSLFNRTPITFLASELTAQATLFDGDLLSIAVSSTGQSFQSVEIGYENRKISATDLRVTVGDETWERVDDPLWEYGPQDKVFNDFTTASGNVEIKFGNGVAGAQPKSGEIITIYWVENLGADGNMPQPAGEIVPALADETGFGSLRGVAQGPFVGGSNAKDARFYRNTASNRRAAQNRAVRRSDYRVMSIDFGDPIKDARLRGQAEIAPYRPSFMNIVEATLLCDPPMTTNQWNAYSQFMTGKGIDRLRLIRKDPTIINLNLSASVFVRPDTPDVTQLSQLLQQHIISTMAPQYNRLGFSWYKSDLLSMLEGANTPLAKYIEYATMTSPTEDVVCVNGVLQWVKLNSLTLSFAFSRRSAYEGRRDNVPMVLQYDAGGNIRLD